MESVLFCAFVEIKQPGQTFIEVQQWQKMGAVLPLHTLLIDDFEPGLVNPCCWLQSVLDAFAGH
ncbi:MAG: hypothetical protein ACI9UK_001458 [Candidatus Krumholzibacteriia bacterium]|jgi:hypothetical protein